MKRNILLISGAILLLVFTAVAITRVKSIERINNFQTIQLKNRDNELKLEQIKTEKLKTELNNGKAKSQEEIDRLNKEIQERKQNEERLQSELQAKLDAKKAEQSRIANAANKLTGTATASAAAPRAYAGGGNKDAWLAAAGIPQDQWGYVDSIVSRESGWRPDAVNPNGGACGLAQALPCSKMGPNWSDPVVALKWQYNYVTQRYGGYPQAVAFWNINHWY